MHLLVKASFDVTWQSFDKQAHHGMVAGGWLCLLLLQGCT
jgi:hypothetical protein